jgi:Ca2+:H+ antiporter
MRYLNYLGYAAIPIAFLVHYWIGHDKSWEPIATFALASFGVIPLAHLMGRATEQLAEETGPTWGGLLNATFGNAAELIIGVIALTKGLNDVVKASLTGSILGNLLLVAGAAMVVGGWNREKQTFSREALQANAGLLVIAVAGMLFPAIFHFTYQLRDADLVEHEHAVSIGTSIILLIVYGLGLIFTLKTHSHIFSRGPGASPEEPPGMSALHERWSAKKSVILLLVASAGIAVVAEMLVGSAEAMAEQLGWNRIFVGVILLAIIGNAAEHSTALLLAKRNDMDTAMTIAHQSSLQIALFATPFLVLLSTALTACHVGHSRHMDLIFSPMEVVAVMITVLIVVVLGLDGATNWFEGALLLAVYIILGIVFFYIPTTPSQGYDGARMALEPPHGRVDVNVVH